MTSAPNFLHMDALGVAQAILGQRRGIAPETAAIIEAETKRHDDPSVPRRKR